MFIGTLRLIHISFRGLPVEIRYQLPLALGTANETEKECTICQLLYGIGDHIVTLPCEHFFQYVPVYPFFKMNYTDRGDGVALVVWINGSGITHPALFVAQKSL